MVAVFVSQQACGHMLAILLHFLDQIVRHQCAGHALNVVRHAGQLSDHVCCASHAAVNEVKTCSFKYKFDYFYTVRVLQRLPLKAM